MQPTFLSMAQYAATVVRHVLVNERNLAPPVKWLLTQTNRGNVWLFAVLDERNLGRNISAYTNQSVLHQLSTALNGKPVILSNTTGLRYAVLLQQRPQLPALVSFPGNVPGKLLLGERQNGSIAAVTPRQLGHVMVAGQTGSGKSNFLRLLAYQAIANGHNLIVIDTQDRTLPRLNGNPKVLKYAASIEQATAAIGYAAAVYQERVKAFSQAGSNPDDLDDYNRSAGSPLPRVFVFVEEFCGLVTMFGKSSTEYETLLRLAWESRKYGLHLICAGQTWEKAITGQIREQMQSRICFQVANAAQSKIVIDSPIAAKLSRPGLAFATFGAKRAKLQTFILTNEAMSSNPQAAGPQERAIVEAALTETEGKVTIAWLKEKLQIKHHEAQLLAAQWEGLGWLEKRPADNNARYLTDAFIGFMGVNA